MLCISGNWNASPWCYVLKSWLKTTATITTYWWKTRFLKHVLFVCSHYCLLKLTHCFYSNVILVRHVAFRMATFCCGGLTKDVLSLKKQILVWFYSIQLFCNFHTLCVCELYQYWCTCAIDGVWLLCQCLTFAAKPRLQVSSSKPFWGLLTNAAFMCIFPCLAADHCAYARLDAFIQVSVWNQNGCVSC